MPAVRTPALILHTFPYGDTSRILRILTPEYGVRSLIARGASSPRSRFGALLEPFTEGEAQFNLRENRDLFTMSGFSLVRSRQAIGRDLLAFAGASLGAELVLRFATDESYPELYSSVASGLDDLATRHDDSAPAALAAIWRIVSLFGLQPRMDACVVCGSALPPATRARFHADLGGVACERCRAGGRSIDPAVRREVHQLGTGEPFESASVTSRRLHGEILSSFLSAHLLHGRPLRSLPIFLDALR